MQKVKEAKLARVKSKGKGKMKVIEEAMEEAQRKRLKKLKAERAVIQEIVISHHLIPHPYNLYHFLCHVL
jgi:hypothetical protein